MALTCGMARVEQPSPAVVAGFNAATGTLEARLAAQNKQGAGLVILKQPATQTPAHLRNGELVIENLTPPKADLPWAMLYHWRGTAFVPGARAINFEQFMRNFAAYPRIYTPQVLSAKVPSQKGDHHRAKMRV